MEEQSGGSVAPPPPAGAPALASVALTALAPTAGSCRIRLCGVSRGDLVGVSHNLIATGNSEEPRESTKTPILQRRSLKNGPEVKQCVRGSAGCISERAAARAQLTGSLCPLPGHHAASEASPFCTLCLREHPPSSRPGRAFSARRLCRGASRPPALDAPLRASVLAVWAPRAGWALWSVWPRLLPFSRFNVPSASRAASSQESAGGS